MKIQGIQGMTNAQIQEAIDAGGRFVLFKYCFSVLVMTFRRPTDIYFVKAGESRVKAGLPWTLLTLMAGWWGIPWGPIFSVQCLANNLGGGQDVTAEIQGNLRRQNAPPARFPAGSTQPPPLPGLSS